MKSSQGGLKLEKFIAFDGDMGSSEGTILLVVEVTPCYRSKGMRDCDSRDIMNEG